MPSVASFSTMAASAAAGGFALIRFASVLKYAWPSRSLTMSRTGFFMSMLASTVPAGGV
jgi:hypothetical protein